MKLPCLCCFGKKFLGKSKAQNIDVQSGDMNLFNDGPGIQRDEEQDVCRLGATWNPKVSSPPVDTACTCDKYPVNGGGGCNNQLKGIRFDNGGDQLDFQIAENENQGGQEPNSLRPCHLKNKIVEQGGQERNIYDKKEGQSVADSEPGPCHCPNPEEPHQTMSGLVEAPTYVQQEQIIFEACNCGNKHTPNKPETQGNDVQNETEKPSTGKLPNEVQGGKEPDVKKPHTKLNQLGGIRFSDGDFQVDFLIVKNENIEDREPDILGTSRYCSNLEDPNQS